jgi:hypothetical protein
LSALTNPGSSEAAAKVDSEADELFTRNSVAQVKEIQRRLRYTRPTDESTYWMLTCATSRNDADAKQEELRLMVGCVLTRSSLPPILMIP